MRLYLDTEDMIEEFDGLVQSGAHAGADVDDFADRSRLFTRAQCGIDDIRDVNKIA